MRDTRQGCGVSSRNTLQKNPTRRERTRGDSNTKTALRGQIRTPKCRRVWLGSVRIIWWLPFFSFEIVSATGVRRPVRVAELQIGARCHRASKRRVGGTLESQIHTHHTSIRISVRACPHTQRQVSSVCVRWPCRRLARAACSWSRTTPATVSTLALPFASPAYRRSSSLARLLRTFDHEREGGRLSQAEAAWSRYGIPVETVYVADDVALNNADSARGQHIRRLLFLHTRERERERAGRRRSSSFVIVVVVVVVARVESPRARARRSERELVRDGTFSLCRLAGTLAVHKVCPGAEIARKRPLSFVFPQVPSVSVSDARRSSAARS